MTIYTRFGSPVTIISQEQDNQNTWLKVRLEDGTIREWAAYEFRADGGWKEIQDAIDALKPATIAQVEPAVGSPMTVDAHGNALCERCHSQHIFYADSERFCQSCLLAIESEYDAKIAREEAQALYNSDSGVDADDYRTHIDTFAPELCSAPATKAADYNDSETPLIPAIAELDRIIKAHHERMDACEYGSHEHDRLGYSMVRWQLQLERRKSNSELDALRAEIENLRQDRAVAWEALQKLAEETTPHPLYPIDPYHHGFGTARNAARQIAEGGLIKSNYYVHSVSPKQGNSDE